MSEPQEDDLVDPYTLQVGDVVAALVLFASIFAMLWIPELVADVAAPMSVVSR